MINDNDNYKLDLWRNNRVDNSYENYLCDTPRGVPEYFLGVQDGWRCPRHKIRFYGLDIECPLCEKDRERGWHMSQIRKERERVEQERFRKAIAEREVAEAKRKKEAELMAKIKKRQDEKAKIDDTVSIKSLLERAYTELEYKDWEKADIYFEKVLDRESKCALAYLGMICAHLKVSNEKNLSSVKSPTDITNHKYYERAIADPSIKSRLDGYIRAINDRIATKKEAARKKHVQDAFDSVCKIMDIAHSPTDYREVITAFNNIDSSYQDINIEIKTKMKECEQKRVAAEEVARKKRVQDAFDSACKIMNRAQNSDDYQRVIAAFSRIDSSYQDINTKIKAKIKECEQKIFSNDFDNACKIMDSAKSLNDYDRAISAFSRIRFNADGSGYQDMNSNIKRKITECESKKSTIETTIRKRHELFLNRLNWLKRNLSLYTFHSADAKKMRKEIEGIVIRHNTSSMTLMEVQNDLIVHERLFTGFCELFQDDFVLACLGLVKGLDRRGEITAVNADAFFLKEFMKNNVH